MKELTLADHPDVKQLILPRRESQRARLLVAAFEVVGERGIRRAAVADFVKEAGVSRGTFYELFGSKEDCFIAAYRHATEILLELVNAASRDALGDWRAGLRAAIGTYLRLLAASPDFARAGLLEIRNAGDAGQAEINVTITRFAQAYGWLFHQAANDDPALETPSPEALFVLVAGIEELVCKRARESGFAKVTELEDAIISVSSAVLLGTREAAG